MSRKIEDLRPECQEAARDTLAAWQTDGELRALGVSGVLITETRRELAVQMAYFSRGRMAPEHVRMMYAAAGINQQLSDKDTQIPITRTLKSQHLSGLAMDAVPMRNGKLWWDAPAVVWHRMGAIAEQRGWEWGGRWKDFPDMPHYQWKVPAENV